MIAIAFSIFSFVMVRCFTKFARLTRRDLLHHLRLAKDVDRSSMPSAIFGASAHEGVVGGANRGDLAGDRRARGAAAFDQLPVASPAPDASR